MDLFLTVSQGVGLSTAAGIRAFGPALLAGALARADAGLDFEGTKVAFMERPWFLALMAVLAVAVLLLERSGPNDLRPLVRRVDVVCGVVLGALLFGGSLADEGHAFGLGLAAGAVVTVVARVGSSAFFGRARERVRAQEGSTAPLEAAEQAAALALAGLAVLAPPISWPALAFLVWAALSSRRRESSKYEGLRSLR